MTCKVFVVTQDDVGVLYCSINLITVMNSLSNIAKQRPTFFSRVVQAFEALHGNNHTLVVLLYTLKY